MKKALVISLLVLVGLSAAAFAGPLSGKWCSTFYFDWVADGATQFVTLPAFSSTLEVDYTVCGWTFSSTADFSKHGFANLYFEGQGSVGAFGFYGVLDFVPQTPNFGFLAGFVDVSIAGVNLYGGGEILNFNRYKSPDTTDPLIGVGWVVGGYGVAGDCAIWAEAQWNMTGLIGNIYSYDYETAIDRILYYSTYYCAEKKPGYLVQTATCCPCWLSLDVYVEYPFACFDVLTKVNFDCTSGFDYVCFYIDDICTGLDWLLLDDLDLCFNVQTKSLCANFELVLADCVCFTPYLSLVVEDNVISGISFNALLIEYDMGQGVTFKAGSLFDTMWGDHGIGKVGLQDSQTCDSNDTYCFDSNGNLVDVAACCINSAYDEYFAVLIDGDACCGGAFSVEIYNWFNDDQLATGTNFMDWIETEVDISVGIGANTTLSFGFDLGQAGLLNWAIGWCFEW
jgi:hypothetical protein